MKARLRKIAFALVPTVALVVVLEVVARSVERADRRAHAADESGESADLARRGDEKLVYVYGESTVVGAPVPEIGFVAQMRRIAARRHPEARIRFVNLGRSGADSAELRATFEATIGLRPDLAVVLGGHNEFLRPGLARHDALPSRLALVRVIGSTLVGAFPSLRSRVEEPQQATRFDRADELFRRKGELYRENLAAVVRAAKDADAPLLLATLPSNVLDWPPIFRGLPPPDGDAGYEATMEVGLEALERGDVAALRTFVAAQEARRRDDPTVMFLRGRLRRLDGDEAGARADLVAARDADPMPVRATSAFNDAVRSLAAREGTLFCDLEEAVAAGGVPGFDVMADQVHPGPEAARRMARAVVDAAERAGVLPTTRAVEDEPLADFLAAVGYAPGSPLRVRWLLQLGRSAIRPPFLDFRLAERTFRQAARERPDSWEARANLATALLLLGRKDEGLSELREATRLHSGALNLDDRDATPLLKEALRIAGGG